MRRTGPVLPIVLLALAVPATAGSPETGDARLARHAVVPAGDTIGIEPRPVHELPADDAQRAGWERFRARRDPAWKAWLDERTALPTLALGPGLPLGPGSIEQGVLAFLTAERDWLGDGWGTFEIDRAATLRLQRDHEQVVLRQVVDGVRVENARFDFHVNRGRLVMFGATHWAPVSVSGVPSVSVEAARDRVKEHLGEAFGQLHPKAGPELTIRAVDAGPGGLDPTAWSGARGAGIEHVLLWRFRFAEPAGAPSWVAEVDAHRGTLHAVYEDTDSATTVGGVFPFSNDGDCGTGGCEIGRLPMPYLDVTEDGQTATVADAFGDLQCVDPAAGYSTGLSGPYFRISDACGPFTESGTCAEGLDLGNKVGENCAVDPLSSPGNTAAARTAYYHLNRAAEAARFYDPSNAWLQSRVTVNVNDPYTCNAFWDGEITLRGEGNGCGNMGEIRGILVHEWGHGHDHNDGGGSDSPSEAYADVMALFAGRDSCIARGWYNDGRTCDGNGNACLTCTGVRDIDWAAKAWNAPATVPGFVASQCTYQFGGSPCNRQSHCAGHVVGETMYDLAARDLPASGLDADTAWQVAERLWYLSRQGSGGNMYYCIFPNVYSCGATSLHQRLLVTDDDDGDLTNGTPHAAAIFAAFSRHGLACGSAGDPANQSSAACPAIAAPVLSAVETPAGTELSWSGVQNAGEYRVYGNEIGCDQQQTALASLPATETSFLHAGTDPEVPRTYRVEALGANASCSGPVSNCVETFSGARLQIGSHRFLETGTVNGFPDPGETVGIPVTLFNSGVEAAVGTQGTLTFVDPAQGTVLDGQATWSGPDPSAFAEADAPYFEVEIADTVGCGDVVAFELQVGASNATGVTRPFSVRLGEHRRDFLQDQDLIVPSDPAGPFTSTIQLDQDWTLAELDVSIDVTQPQEEDLIVELTSPQGTVVRLHDRSTLAFGIHERYDATRAPDGPGTMDDFVGESTLGTWTLSVEDAGSNSNGDSILSSWTLHATIEQGFDCVPAACNDPVPTGAPVLTVERWFDGVDHDLEFQWTGVAGVAGYRVLQAPVAAFDAGVALLAEPGPSASNFAIVEPASPDLLFFQVRGVNACGEEGP